MPITIPKDLIKYSSFILACSLVVFVFVTATTFNQLAAGILIYPLLVIFAYKIFSHKIRSHPSKRPASSIKPPVPSAQTVPSQSSSVGITDIDKRVFLKLIGGTGLSLFLFSLFNKKTEDIFFKNLPGRDKIVLADPSGKKIIPAQAHPLDGYKIAEIEDNTISFHGFVNNDGAWYVLRVDTVAGSFRYARGDRDFPGSWENRENLDYGYFNRVFNP